MSKSCANDSTAESAKNPVFWGKSHACDRKSLILLGVKKICLNRMFWGIIKPHSIYIECPRWVAWTPNEVHSPQRSGEPPRMSSKLNCQQPAKPDYSAALAIPFSIRSSIKSVAMPSGFILRHDTVTATMSQIKNCNSPQGYSSNRLRCIKAKHVIIVYGGGVSAGDERPALMSQLNINIINGDHNHGEHQVNKQAA